MDIINKNREQIDLIDREIVILLNKRFDLCKQIGQEKHKLGITTAYVPKREQQIINNLSKEEKYSGMIQTIWPIIMNFSKSLQ